MSTERLDGDRSVSPSRLPASVRCQRPPALIDTTIREGQQHGFVGFSTAHAVGLARQLDAFGVDLVEVGHPVVSPQDRETARAICAAGLRAPTLAHARAVLDDVAAAVETGAQWVGIFAGVNAVSLRHKLHRSQAEALRAIEEAVAAAKAQGLRVRFTCEDASRTPPALVTKVFACARAAGADRLSFADTVGVMTPGRMRAAIARLTRRFDTVLHVHCHNDFGLATANVLAAVEGGAVGVDVSVDGIGERCGIASLAEVTAALTQLYRLRSPWRLAQLPELSRELRACLEEGARDTRPLVGRYAFTHKAGLHIAAALECASAYEPCAPHLLGRTRRFLLSRLVGMRALEGLRRRGRRTVRGKGEAVSLATGTP